ncbi:hypothetical protein A6R68_13089 [Neotoma lepida]|uniref:ESF1 RRM domain-containing protein n=1 Tax=Neotoma lepida TaxID=56216 RepID=A0A1A6H229_NEOLE|nr:hypothetical protein A6R68_13089 [Neotoma lepida]
MVPEPASLELRGQRMVFDFSGYFFSKTLKMSSKQEIMNDQRFRRVSKDPRFWEMPEKDRKVKIDKRFRAMFHDKKFKLNYAVDKRGRPITHSTTEDLKRFYELSDSDSDLSDEESKVLNQKKVKQKQKQTKKEVKSKMLIEEKKKETKKIDQEDPINKNDLNKSERIQKMKNLCKSQKVDSEISPKKDSEEFLQNTKKKRSITDHSADSLPKGKPRTKDSSTSEIVKSPTITCSKAKREKQSVIMARDNDSKMLDKDALEEDSDSASEIGSDEESEDEITSDDRTSADDDENEDLQEEEDEDSEDDDESDSGPDLARGKGNIETSSEDEDDFEDLFPEEPGFEHAWRELDKDAPRADEITHRLAVCNMDWDRLKAKDLLALFNSFKPKGGVVFSVKIYPSEFGKERMKEEQVQGPVEITWDETDHERITTLNRKFKKEELLDMDFQAYLASSSEDEEEEEEAPQGENGVSVEDGKTKKNQKDDEEQIAKYRQLLQVIKEKEKKGKENDMEMEIKWVPGLKESAEEMVRNKLEGKDKLTPWEQFLEKKKEKRRLKKKQKALTEEASEDELPSDVDLNDPYFAEEVKKIGIKKKSMKSAKDNTSSEEETELEKQKAEMALLVMDEEEDSKKHFNYDKILWKKFLRRKPASENTEKNYLLKQ